MKPNALPMEPVIRKPVESNRAHFQRRKTVGLGILIALILAGAIAVLLLGCGGSPAPVKQNPPPPADIPLTKLEVMSIVQNAALAVDGSTMAIAVVDRRGDILAVYNKPGVVPGTTKDIGNFGIAVDVDDLAVALARTAAYFSNDQAPLSSRTVRFISGIHFPPGVDNAPTADLYGIENTNRGCTLFTNFIPGKEINPSNSLSGVAGTGPGILTGKSQLDDSDPNAVNPGGVPIFRGSLVVGGIGVAGVSHDAAEFAAVSGAKTSGFSFIPNPLPDPGAVFIGGIALPLVNNTSLPAGANPGTANGNYFKICPDLPAACSNGQPPINDLIQPTAGSMLTAAEVQQVLDNAQATAEKTRAAIRLPTSSATSMVIAVADLDGTLIGLRRMPDSTIFSIDVAASKARNMVYFNGPNRTTADLPGVPMGTAVTSRTISFGAQPLFPPGINGSGDGPFYNLFLQDVQNPCTQGNQTGAANSNKSGVVFFPGAVGLFKNGTLVGGLGVSGDGVDQDDFVTAGGSVGFEAPTAIRADQIFISGVRLPYFKFPRNPTF
ncbi:MAG TPA: heme-binding protein [Candidatus Baltobacteraceae bacterium]|nr:heme-binding protein [Candidatus Baltobacteraceae bacterium]